jgi:crooked neck
MPEALWKSYIDSEIADGARAAARALYERLLARTGHVKVWLSYAAFEAAPLPEGEGAEGAAAEGGAEGGAEGEAEGEGAAERAAAARSVYTRAERALASAPGAGANKEARVMLLEAWRAFEAAAGTAASLQSVEARLPKRVKRRRALLSEDGTPAGMEEYYDYMCAPVCALFVMLLLCFCAHLRAFACVCAHLDNRC